MSSKKVKNQAPIVQQSPIIVRCSDNKRTIIEAKGVVPNAISYLVPTIAKEDHRRYCERVYIDLLKLW